MDGQATGLRGLELWWVDDVPPDVVEQATAAAQEKLDELKVSALEANLALFNIETMDDHGALYDDDPNFEPDYAKWGVNLDHLEANNAAAAIAGEVIKRLFPSREVGSIGIGITEDVISRWRADGSDISKQA